MTLAIAVKGTEGIVLAVDSRVTVQFEHQNGGNKFFIPATYDNATKILHMTKHRYVGALTFGNALFDVNKPRTAHSFLPEFEAALPDKRTSVKQFATKLAEFYGEKLKAAPQIKEPTGFLIGGYDEGEPYGRLYEVSIPNLPDPREVQADSFGAQWAGQIATTSALLGAAAVPWQLLPLQDCVDVAIFAVRTTAELQKYVTDIRGVGGPIDVATITKIDGFSFVQSKSIRGERSNAGI